MVMGGPVFCCAGVCMFVVGWSHFGVIGLGLLSLLVYYYRSSASNAVGGGGGWTVLRTGEGPGLDLAPRQ